MIYVGIDPGKDGALVALDAEGRILSKHKTPLITGGGSKGEYDIPGALNLLGQLQSDPQVRVSFFLEKIMSLPASMGGSSANYERGFASALWRTALTSLGCSHTLIVPRTWQKVMFAGTPAKLDPKVSAKLVAATLWPKETWLRTEACQKPDQGFIDGALIAEFGRRTFGERG